MKRILLRALAGASLLTAFVYGCDDLYVRLRKAPLEDVRVDRILAVAEKFNKIDYERTEAITEKCVDSLFPHFGHEPCWYLKRHTVRIVPIG